MLVLVPSVVAAVTPPGFYGGNLNSQHRDGSAAESGVSRGRGPAGDDDSPGRFFLKLGRVREKGRGVDWTRGVDRGARGACRMPKRGVGGLDADEFAAVDPAQTRETDNCRPCRLRANRASVTTTVGLKPGRPFSVTLFKEADRGRA